MQGTGWKKLRGASTSPAVITRDPQPVHLAADFDLVLADHRHIVLGRAGDDAGVAADAGIEIDHHAPGVFRRRLCRIEARLRLRWLRQRRMFGADLANEIKAIHAMMQLRDRQGLGGCRPCAGCLWSSHG